MISNLQSHMLMCAIAAQFDSLIVQANGPDTSMDTAEIDTKTLTINPETLLSPQRARYQTSDQPSDTHAENVVTIRDGL